MWRRAAALGGAVAQSPYSAARNRDAKSRDPKAGAKGRVDFGPAGTLFLNERGPVLLARGRSAPRPRPAPLTPRPAGQARQKQTSGSALTPRFCEAILLLHYNPYPGYRRRAGQRAHMAGRLAGRLAGRAVLSMRVQGRSALQCSALQSH